MNPEGRDVDLSWEQVKEFCTSLGLKTVPEICGGEKYYDGYEDTVQWMLDKRWADIRPDLVPVDKGKVDEGVCIRRDGLRPLILKAKSPMFLQHETKMIDKEVTDMEEDG